MGVAINWLQYTPFSTPRLDCGTRRQIKTQKAACHGSVHATEQAERVYVS